MQFSNEQFNQVKNDAEKFYFEIKSVHCPYFGKKINFNRKGFDHIVSKSWNRGRSEADQFSRFRYLVLVPEIIKQSRTLQGFRSTRKFERVKVHNRWDTVMKKVYYFEFIAVVNFHNSQIRLKIIIKQIEGGEKFFFSIIPFWKTDKETGERILYDNNFEHE